MASRRQTFSDDVSTLAGTEVGLLSICRRGTSPAGMSSSPKLEVAGASIVWLERALAMTAITGVGQSSRRESSSRSEASYEIVQQASPCKARPPVKKMSTTKYMKGCAYPLLLHHDPRSFPSDHLALDCKLSESLAGSCGDLTARDSICLGNVCTKSSQV